MIREFATRYFILVAVLWPTFAKAERPGETLIVTRRTELKSGEKVLGILPPGEEVLVKEVKGEFVRVSSVRTGWVRRTDVSRPDRAYAIFDRQVFMQAAGADPYLGRAGSAECVFKLDEAVGDYGKAIRRDPKNLETYVRRGHCWLAMGKRDEAMADFTKALSLDPKDPVALHGNAVVLMQKGRLDDARRDIEKVIQLAPDYAEAYITRGFVQRHRREFEKAIGDFNKAIELKGYDPNVVMHRGDAWFESGSYDKAIDDYSAAYRIFRSNFYLRHRAKAYLAAGKPGLAIDDLKAVVWTETSDGETLNELAWLQATCPDDQARDGAGAVKNATKACELTDWKDFPRLDTLAAAYAESGDFGHAVGFQKKALSFAPQALKAEVDSRLQLYKTRKPYRERLSEISSRATSRLD
jgi:tetratricopeptide (TPR) repeat protein